MINRPFTARSLRNRRQIIGDGIGFASGLALGLGVSRAALAQSTAVAELTQDGYARPEMLVDADRLAEARPLESVVGFMPPDEFAEEHLPGSVQLDWPTLEVIDTSDASIAAWREETTELLAGLGVTPDRKAIAYDGGTLFTARLWWVRHYLGHGETQVLDGGLAAWRQAVGEIATGDSVSPTATPAPRGWTGTPRDAALAQLTRVRASLGDPAVAIVDARTPEEYAAGHIPGAVNINYPRNTQAEEPKFWLPADELRAMYSAVGVTPDKRIIPYCATGVRSAVTFFTLRLIGFPDVALYTGSWEEWQDHPGLPKATGSEPG